MSAIAIDLTPALHMGAPVEFALRVFPHDADDCGPTAQANVKTGAATVDFYPTADACDEIAAAFVDLGAQLRRLQDSASVARVPAGANENPGSRRDTAGASSGPPPLDGAPATTSRAGAT